MKTVMEHLNELNANPDTADLGFLAVTYYNHLMMINIMKERGIDDEAMEVLMEFLVSSINNLKSYMDVDDLEFSIAIGNVMQLHIEERKLTLQ